MAIQRILSEPEPLPSPKLCDEDAPYALADPDEVQRRVALLTLPHVHPLVAYLVRLRAVLSEPLDTPLFDPCDGGVNARALLLLEAPGPKAVGSTFISRNNPDPSARNICRLLYEAGLARTDTLLWNIVPWYVGTGTRIRPVRRAEIAQAIPYLEELLGLLPKLRVIVLCGRKAQVTLPAIRAISAVSILQTHHPSARVFNVWPHKRDEVRATFRQAAELVESGT